MSWSPCPDPQLGDRQSVDAIDTVLVPRAVDVGGFVVRRALPSTERMMVGPFIFFDEMGPAEFMTNEGIDVRPHPHINLATVTYLIDGEIVHRDSLGTQQRIRPGAVNWMSAGRGIVHSERTTPEDRERKHRLFGLQTWVALPTDAEEGEPCFKHHGAEALPVVEADGVDARLIAGDAFDESSPLETASATLYADIQLSAGAHIPIAADYPERAIYTLSGQVEAGGSVFDAHQLVLFKPGERIHIQAQSNARFMLFGGEPMGEPRYIWWNFVSSRLDRIEQAKEEWARGRFDTVPGDEEEFIPLPEGPGRPRKSKDGRRSTE